MWWIWYSLHPLLCRKPWNSVRLCKQLQDAIFVHFVYVEGIDSQSFTFSWLLILKLPLMYSSQPWKLDYKINGCAIIFYLKYDCTPSLYVKAWLVYEHAWLYNYILETICKENWLVYFTARISPEITLSLAAGVEGQVRNDKTTSGACHHLVYSSSQKK